MCRFTSERGVSQRNVVVGGGALVVSEREQRKSVNHCFAVMSPDGTLQLMVGQLGVDALPSLRVVDW